MDVLADVLDAYAGGELTDDERRALRDLADDAIQTIPAMERLGLTLLPRATPEEITTAPART